MARWPCRRWSADARRLAGVLDAVRSALASEICRLTRRSLRDGRAFMRVLAPLIVAGRRPAPRRVDHELAVARRDRSSAFFTRRAWPHPLLHIQPPAGGAREVCDDYVLRRATPRYARTFDWPRRRRLPVGRPVDRTGNGRPGRVMNRNPAAPYRPGGRRARLTANPPSTRRPRRRKSTRREKRERRKRRSRGGRGRRKPNAGVAWPSISPFRKASPAVPPPTARSISFWIRLPWATRWSSRRRPRTAREGTSLDADHSGQEKEKLKSERKRRSVC